MGDEKGNGLPSALVIVIIMLVIFSVFSFPVYISFTHNSIMNSAERQIFRELHEFEVVDGIIQSPSVIVILDDSLSIFIEKAHELGVDTVYRFEEDFYIFNSDMSMAWRYSVNVDSDGFFALNMRWGNP